MATEKLLNTRIQLKYDTYANWTGATGAAVVLKAGEVGICAIPTGSTAVNGDPIRPQVMMKVGDGTTAFGSLPWVSAKAADVYDWAKKSESEFTTWVKGLIDVGDIDLSAYYKKTEVDGLLSTNSTNDQKYAKDYADALIAALDVTDTAVAGQYVSAVSETDGKISVTRADLPTYTLTTGATNGTVKFNGTEVAVKGLGSAAYTETGAYATAAQGSKADTAVQSISVHGHELKDGDSLTVAQTKTDLGLGSAAYEDKGAFATAAQGSKADSAVQSVAIATGSTNGKVKLTVDGTATEASVYGLGSAAYTEASAYATSAQGAKADSAVQSVKVLGETLTDGGELTVAEAKTALGLGSAAYVETTAFDAAGAAATAKSEAITAAANDAASKYATIKAAEDAQKAANDANAKIDAFMSDDAKVEGAIDTLVELNKYITEDTNAFTGLSERVTKLEDGTVPAKEAEHADVASSLDAAGVTQVEGIKVNNAGHADTADTASNLDEAGKAVVKAVKVDDAAHADNADKLGNVAAASYALKTDAQGYANTAESNAKSHAEAKASAAQAAAIEAAAEDATTKANKALSDAKAYADGLADDYATAAQGAKADTAVQSATFAGTAMTKDGTGLSITQAAARTALGLGSAAYTESTAYATAAQGSKADSAVQSVKVLGETLTDGGELTVAEAKTALGLKSAAYTESSAYATAAQGTKADSALQSVAAGTGLKVSAKANNAQTIEIDTDVVFVLNGGSATTFID